MKVSLYYYYYYYYYRLLNTIYSTLLVLFNSHFKKGVSKFLIKRTKTHKNAHFLQSPSGKFSIGNKGVGGKTSTIVVFLRFFPPKPPFSKSIYTSLPKKTV